MTPVPEPTDVRTPMEIDTAQYSARLWDTMQREFIEDLQTHLLEVSKGNRQNIARGREFEHRAAVAEWERDRLRDALNALQANHTLLSEALDIAQNTITIQEQTITLKDAHIKRLEGPLPKLVAARKRKAVRRG